MLIDLTTEITIKSGNIAAENEKMVSFGHLGTHFDVMDKKFPIEFTKRTAIVFNVKGLPDINLSHIDCNLIKNDMFIAFYTGFIDDEPYGTKKYFTEHPQISKELIEKLLDKSISIIGIDFAGIRRGEEHTSTDAYCADKGVFIVENLCNLDRILKGRKYEYFKANTYPVNFIGMSGLPCRVVAET